MDFKLYSQLVFLLFCAFLLVQVSAGGFLTLLPFMDHGWTPCAIFMAHSLLSSAVSVGAQLVQCSWFQLFSQVDFSSSGGFNGAHRSSSAGFNASPARFPAVFHAFVPIQLILCAFDICRSFLCLLF
ncbi:unnamed protein product [Ilex paraguariensis]|uniref:Uncharacterized protein n=1 Tax=Ilex paraguariensis TaxID=185542 RepID=A0ABC8SN76_9AQUA